MSDERTSRDIVHAWGMACKDVAEAHLEVALLPSLEKLIVMWRRAAQVDCSSCSGFGYHHAQRLQLQGLNLEKVSSFEVCPLCLGTGRRDFRVTLPQFNDPAASA